MPVVGAFAVPHPTFVLPGIGHDPKEHLPATVEAYRNVARRAALLRPDAVVIASPHAACYADYIPVSPGLEGVGTLAALGRPDVQISTPYDPEFAAAITEECLDARVAGGTAGGPRGALDHGTMVPLAFLHAAGVEAPVVRVGVSALSALDHYRFGQCVQRAAERLDRRVVFVASGDLSHRLRPGGPYGFTPEGPAFDRQICRVFASGDFGELMHIDRDHAEGAAQCGLPCFQMMAGALDGSAVCSELLSYEGPFGVGYATAAFVPVGPTHIRSFGDELAREQTAAIEQARRAEDPYVRLARVALEQWVRTGRRIEPPRDLPDELARGHAAVFVSIYKDGELRGCMGALEPVRSVLAQEIVDNAIAAGTHDRRFLRVGYEELPRLLYRVEVLGEPEFIVGPADLDVARYGVIASTLDGRRGVMLPGVPGVATPEQQVEIACRKGGIDPQEGAILQRFPVFRH